MENNRIYREAGMFLILVSGLIHLYDAPAEYHDAAYLGISFFIFFIGTIVSAVGISRQNLYWGWMLGGALSIGAFAGYLVSRTVGLPISGKEDWGPALAYISILLDVLYFVPLLMAIRPRMMEAH